MTFGGAFLPLGSISVQSDVHKKTRLPFEGEPRREVKFFLKAGCCWPAGADSATEPNQVS
jgi:hypothetical protein